MSGLLCFLSIIMIIMITISITWNAWLVLTMILLCFLSVPVIISMWFKLDELKLAKVVRNRYWVILKLDMLIPPGCVVYQGFILIGGEHVPRSCLEEVDPLLVNSQPKRLWPI